MPVYDCSFPVEAEGLTVTIRNRAGGTVTTGALTDEIVVANALVFRFTADEAVYVGSVSSALLGTLENQAVLNVVASIEAGGGGVSIDEDRLTFEINEGVTLDVTGAFANLIWDTAPDGFAPGVDLAIPPGLYLAQLYVDLGTFADDLVAGAAIGQDVIVQPLALIATAPFTRTVQVTGVIRSRDGIAITASAGFALAGTGDTETVNVSYASLILTPFTPPVG